ncbi:GAF domain-containing protein [Deinococcus sp. UYEF24]
MNLSADASFDPLEASSPGTLNGHLHDVMEALAGTRTQTETLEVVLRPALQALGAIGGAVLLVDATGLSLRLAARQGYVPGALIIWQDGSVEDPGPVADVLRTREALYFEHADKLIGLYPELEARTGAVAAVAIAVLPMVLDDRPIGSLVLDFREPHTFTLEERRFLRTLASHCAIALDRADSLRRLERQLEERTLTLLKDARAQEAFVAFTEVVGSETDLPTLVRQAIKVLEGRFPGASIVYYEQEDGEQQGGLWKARTWSKDLAPELVASLVAGLPAETPLFAEVVKTRQPVFTNAWDAVHEKVALTEEYGAVAGYPLVVSGELHSFLAVGLRDTRIWSEADRGLVRAVGRSLNLALERTATARQLMLQNAELLSRTRALEAFAELSRDLAVITDPLLLIRRAQEVVMPMLADGAALYYEPEGDRWHNRVQHGSLHSPGLQAAIDAGLPYTETNNLLIPWTTGQPYYQDHYDQDTDQLAPVVGHIGATATLPLRVGNTPLGVMVFALFTQRTWSNEDRMLLETAMQSLELALDRARQTRVVTDQRDALDARTQELAASSEELQAFSYSVSHDLRTPVRHMIGFLGLARKTLDGRLDERSARYLDVVEQAAAQMNTLIDALLNLSRAAQQSLRPQMIDLNGIMAQIQTTLLPDQLTRNVQWEVVPLPVVLGDREALKQVLTQLTENALKFTRTRDPAVIKVWAEDQGDAWGVFVQDNGLGFDPRYQDRLFNLFQRLHTADEATGTGVGLASVRRLILKHGGQVFAEGQVDEGATFGFTLPKPSPLLNRS